MSKLVRRVIGWVLVLTLVAAQILIPLPMQVNATEASSYAGNSSAASDIQGGVTLHCWNWSYENIEKNMELIASLGYTAIQTSPIQLAKQATVGYPVNDWWVYYQPAGFNIDDTGTNALGNKAQFKKMCETAHKYGIYVIVDVIANHMGNSTSNNLSDAIIADIRNDSSCWHDYSKNISNYRDRYNITQYCLGGLPDLNTANSKVQNYVLGFLKECIDAGADGFRFDAAKHIETPDDAYCASDFWPNVINGAKSYASSARGLDLYCYGELLDRPDESGSLPESAYTKYMSITDNTWSNALRNNVIGSGNASAFGSGYHKNANSNQLVLWAESHDNYAGDGSKNVSVQNINKAWALAAARANAMSLYLARPENTYPQLLGTASVTGWSYAEVGAVNHFHNYFDGQSEYVSNMNNIACVERGNSGAVLVNCGGTSTNVNINAYAMANGTYTDQITGNTFTVSGGKITGKIGSTGIAVLYNAIQCDHPSHNTDGNCTECNQNVGHSYANGYCSVCGAEEPELEYYLVGYINGADYGCNDDHANLGNYKFVDGKLTATFNEASYVFVKTNDNNWYMTKEYVSGTSGTLYNTNTGANEKMLVPGGVEVTFTLTVNADDTLSLSYAEDVCTHSYDEGKVTTAATCTTAGVKTYTCALCGSSYTEEIPAPGHNYSNGTCTVCGDKETVSTVNYYLVGYINGADYGCNDDHANLGNYKFVDGKLTVTFKEDSYVFVKTDDNNWYMTKEYVPGTSGTFYNTNTGANEKMFVPGGVEVTFTLTVNAGDTLTLSYAEDGCTHSYSSSVTTAATCTTAGVKTYTCALCGSSYTEEIPAPGHNYSNGTCTVCGDKETVSTVNYYLVGYINGADYGCNDDHANLGNYKFVDGKLTVTFKEDSYVFVKTDDNNWYMTKEYVPGTSGTFYNTKTGSNEKMFVPGGVEITFTLTVNADDTLTLRYAEDGCTHSYSSSVTTAATCTTAGVKTYTCTLCGSSYTEEIPAPGHNYSNGTCTVCGDKETESTVNYYLVGYINGADYGCNDDHANLGNYKFVDGKLTATFNEDSYVFVKTDDNNWYMTMKYVLGTSGTFYNTKTGSNEKMFVPGGVEVTFTLTVNADDTLTLSYAEASCAHSYSSSVTTAATCTTAGVKTYTCTLCGDSYTEDIPASGHNYSAAVTAPTCTADGYTTYTCSNCSDTYTDDVTSAIGHSYESVVTAPTFDTDGYTTHTCTVCGDSYVDSVVPATGFTLAGANTVLGGILDMNFFINPSDLTGSDYYAQITLYTESGAVTTIVPYADWEVRTNYLVVTQKGLAARQMADKIDVVIYNGDGTQASYLWEDSIRGYVMRILEKQNAETKTMLVDMLNYGAAAQNFFKYNTDDLANNQLSETQKGYATETVTCTDHRVKGTGYYGSSLTLKDRILLTMYFNNITPDMYAIVSFTDHKGTAYQTRVEGSQFSQYNSSVYGVVVDELVVADGDQLVTVTVYNAAGDQVATASDSVNSYAARQMGQDALYEMVAKFTSSAYAYFH